jgi:hypothetical protein
MLVTVPNVFRGDEYRRRISDIQEEYQEREAQAVQRAQRRGARQGHGGDPHSGRLHDRPGARRQADDARAVQRHCRAKSRSSPRTVIEELNHRLKSIIESIHGWQEESVERVKAHRQRVHPRHHRPDAGGAEVALPDVPGGAGVPRRRAPGHGRECLGFHAQRAAGRQCAAAQEDLRERAPALPRQRAGRPRRPARRAGALRRQSDAAERARAHRAHRADGHAADQLQPDQARRAASGQRRLPGARCAQGADELLRVGRR